tara:strand:- start:191 stop:1447 length:1257 start_codon:yes stop_codon:yes gene_type:complete
MSLDLNITLQSKDSPNVSLTLSGEAQGIILGSSANAPLITAVSTGIQGAKGLPGTAVIESDSIDGVHLKNSVVTSNKLSTNSVTTDKIAQDSITSIKIEDNAVITSKIADNAITAAKIAPGAITLELIDIFADGAIKPDKLEPGSLLEANFANASVTAQKIANSAITAIKVLDRTLTGSKIEQNVVLDGAKVNGSFQLLGNSPAYLLGPTEDDLHIQSEAGLVFRIDSDNESTNTFLFKNGAGSTVFTLDENGNAIFTGDISTSGTIDGVDVSSLPTTDTNTQLPFFDEDDMASNSATGVPSQQSVKSYIDSNVSTISADNWVTTEKIADDSVTADKLSNSINTAIADNTAKVTDKYYLHTQGSSSSSWVVTHGLGKFPSSTVVDSAGTVVIGMVTYNSLNQVTLTFKATFSGKAYFN